jgi:hypothetical protein
VRACVRACVRLGTVSSAGHDQASLEEISFLPEHHIAVICVWLDQKAHESSNFSSWESFQMNYKSFYSKTNAPCASLSLQVLPCWRPCPWQCGPKPTIIDSIFLFFGVIFDSYQTQASVRQETFEEIFTTASESRRTTYHCHVKV